jgi:hypothetical protein
MLAATALLALVLGASAVSAATPSATAYGAESAAIVHVSNSTPADDAFAKFATCMSEHGIDMSQSATITVSFAPDGALPAPPEGTVESGVLVASGTATAVDGSGSLPAPDPKFEAANEACLPILQDAGIGAAGSVTSGSGTIVMPGPGLHIVPLPAPEGSGH